MVVTTPTVTGGSATSKPITVVATPTIASVAPTSAKAGKDTITITGTGLKGTSLVTFTGNVSAKPSKSTDTTITVKVPKGAQTGGFTITNAGVVVGSGSVALTVT